MAKDKIQRGKALNIYQLTDQLDTTLAKLGVISMKHMEIAKEHGEKILWNSLRVTLVEADNLMHDILKEVKHPDIASWGRKRGYNDAR